jgi:hypothetical protein
MTDRYALGDEEPSTTDTGIMLGTFSGKSDKWDDKKDDLIAYLGLQRNQRNVPLRYVIRNDMDRPDGELNNIDQDIYNIPLTGSTFTSNNYKVYQYLKKWTIGGLAKTHVDE